MYPGVDPWEIYPVEFVSQLSKNRIPDYNRNMKPTWLDWKNLKCYDKNMDKWSMI
jgi:hypothetical protein